MELRGAAGGVWIYVLVRVLQREAQKEILNGQMFSYRV
jgi:hypothetical protein